MSLRTHWIGITTAIMSPRTDSSSDARVVSGLSASQKDEVESEVRFLLMRGLFGQVGDSESVPLKLDILYALLCRFWRLVGTAPFAPDVAPVYFVQRALRLGRLTAMIADWISRALTTIMVPRM